MAIIRTRWGGDLPAWSKAHYNAVPPWECYERFARSPTGRLHAWIARRRWFPFRWQLMEWLHGDFLVRAELRS